MMEAHLSPLEAEPTSPPDRLENEAFEAAEQARMALAVQRLAEASEAANAALLRGDVDAYLSLLTLADDFTLMSPFGGPPGRGAYSSERWEKIGAFFKRGTLHHEVIQSYAVSGMVVLVVLEHGHGEVGGLPAQDWSLRVTLVYRHEPGGWRLVHRHADPLARGISLDHSAALARGDFRDLEQTR